MNNNNNILLIILIAGILVLGYLYFNERGNTSFYKDKVESIEKEHEQIKDSLNAVRLDRKNLRVSLDSAANKAYIADSLYVNLNKELSDFIKRNRDGFKEIPIHNDSIDSELERIYSRHGLTNP